MSFPPPPVAFTSHDADRANVEWRCNCGPGAVAGILGITLDQIRPFVGGFERKGYTNPTLMWEILNQLQVPWRKFNKPHGWPTYGLARIQWHGPWMSPGVPPAAAYRRTHWVGACALPGNVGIFDINAVNTEPGSGWVRLEAWAQTIVPWLLKSCVPHADGEWSLTHVVEVDNTGWKIPEIRSDVPWSTNQPSAR